MATQTYEQLIAGANKIKENELPESNTHDLVGEQLLQMTNKMQEESTKTDNSLMEYNVSKFHPTSGTNGSNKYTLESAIALVPAQYRSIGVKCSFINEHGQGETWEYKGGGWGVSLFSRVGAKKFTELANNVGIYNVDFNIPLESGFYTAVLARANVPVDVRKLGLIITYKIDETTSITEQFIGSTTSNWLTDTNWQNIGSEGGNKILSWKTDVATTRKQVPSKERKPGMLISYKPTDSDWINERYIGISTADSEWIKDTNWDKIPNQLQIIGIKCEYEKYLSGLNPEMTQNLFVKNAFYPYTVDNNESFTKSDIFAITRVKVEAGKTYYRFDGIKKSNWNSTNCRLFDDTGFLQVFNGTDIEVPASAKNPYIYLTITQGKGDKYMFTENNSPKDYIPAADYKRIKDLEEGTIKKTVQRTSNLFNHNDKSHAGETITDNGNWVGNGSFDTAVFEVVAGKTYKRYSSAGVLSDWAGTNIRIFDDSGKMLLRTNSTEFTVPEDATNPIAYAAYYNNPSSVGLPDISLFMILESSVSGEQQLPYYALTPEDALVFYLKQFFKDVDFSELVVQETGQSEKNVMSQKAVTNTLEAQKNELQTSIANAILGLTSSTIEQGVGQSVTSTMSQKAISDALAILAEGITGDTQYRFAERPAKGYENFLVDVDVNIATTNSDASMVIDSQNLQKDRCILALPTNYSRSGKPTRLVICGHGTGWKCVEGTSIPWAGMNTQLLLDEGYAVLGCNGTPGDLDGLDQGHNGTPQCYRSILAAYKYVTGKYNIATNGVLTAGLSMGTIMTTQITCFNDIPVLAQVVFSPSFELMKSQFTLKPAVRQRMCEKFGFTGQAPTFTTQDPPSEAEKQYILDNFDKWCGYDTIINGISGEAKETFSVWPNHAVKEDAAEKALYQNKSIARKVPIKMFVCDDDTTASPRWANYLEIMMRNAGCYCEVRHYATGGHNAWGAGDNIEVNTLLGGKKTVNGASYEGLLFLKRFDL